MGVLLTGTELGGMEEGLPGPDCAFFEYPICVEVQTGDMLYVLGRRDTAPCPHCHCLVGRYHIQGLFNDPTLAEMNALDETYFIGPLPLNMALPHDIIEWNGLYWPLQVRKDDSGPPAITQRT